MTSFWNRALGVAVALAAASPLMAQSPGGPWQAGVGGYFETYDFLDPRIIGIESVSLASTPFAVRAPIGGRLGIEVYGAFARARMTRLDGTSTTLSGLTDTEVRASVAVLRDRVTLSFGGIVPTGYSTQTLEEVEVAGLIAADLLPFRVSNWGGGGGGGFSTAVAVPLGGFGVGLSAGYTVGREFEPIEGGDFTYRPGSELRARLVIDRTIGSSAKASLVLGTQRYQEDQVSGNSAFQPGDRLEALASLAFVAGSYASGAVYAGLQHRGAGTLTAISLDTPEQDLVTVGAGLRIPRGAATLVPTLDVRVFRRSDGFGQGHLTSAGSSLELPLGGATLVPSIRGRFGSVLMWEGAETSVRGGEVGLALRLGA